MKSSDSAGSFAWQSASLPGRDAMSIGDLLLASSLALRAASLALAASTILLMIRLESVGFSSIHSSSFSARKDSTGWRTSDETSLSFV